MKRNICVLGLGYVGLPLALELSKEYRVVGFDINTLRVGELNSGKDRTKEVDESTLKLQLNSSLTLSSSINEITKCDVFIVTVPTPIDSNNNPDLTPLKNVSSMLSQCLKKNDIVVYESTVFPGCTEEFCVPILEQSGLIYNKDFFVGYSPERINPGDKEHTLRTIKKVVSGSNTQTAEILAEIYSSVVDAGIHLAPNLRTAEAAKVIENTQRDINIAFVNELSMIFQKMGIDTFEVLEAAGTKWNFLPFKPGLVGGHCIGVDPYYLAQKAVTVGHHPEMILAGRRINDTMSREIASLFIKKLITKSVNISEASCCVLGITFKENCPDIRNTKVIDLVKELQSYSMRVDCYDPHADSEEVQHEYGLLMQKEFNSSNYDHIILAVSHNEFLEIDFTKFETVVDIKGILPKAANTFRI